jgi:PAS domain S-box-containing protein
MNVRTRLALATAVALLALLLTFYVGGRVILLNAFHLVEQEILRSVPDLVRTMRGELRQLEQCATALSSQKPMTEALRLRQGSILERECPAAWMTREDVHLVALADATGQVLAAACRAPGGDATHAAPPSLQQHFQAGSPLLGGTNASRSLHAGMLVLEGEGPLLVAVQRIPADPAAPATGVLLVGRSLESEALMQRLGAALPGLRLGHRKPQRLSVARGGAEGTLGRLTDELVSEQIETTPWRVSRIGSYEARLPVYDIYGRQAASLVITQPGMFSSLAETALAWLSLFVALVGILFIAPLLVMQGHAVLNPLTRLASEIQSLPFRGSGQRLAWEGADEFSVVARAVNGMLDAIEQEHRKIEESETRNRALLQANPDLMLLFDRDGRVLDIRCPPDADEPFAADPAAAIGRNLKEVRPLPADVVERMAERVRAAFETGQVQSLEFHVVRPDGRDYWGESRIVRVDANRALVIERNVTDRNRAERGRRLLEVRIGQKQKMESLGLLASGIAHDFNNILAAILGHAEAAVEQTGPDAPAAEALASIRSAAIRASGLTRQLQSYAGQGTFEFNAVNLNHLLGDMAQLLRSSLSKKASLEMNLDPGLPLIEGDPSQLWQVAMNLLLNASEALDGKPGTIGLTTRRVAFAPAELAEFLSVKPLAAGTYVLLEIRDTGHGMTPEVQARIFDPFFSTKSRGRGLGLSAVVGVVQAHGGGIAVQSNPGAGTTFRILLPQAAVQAPSAPAPVAPAATREEDPDMTRPKHLVLVAEDDPDIRKVTVIALRSAGYEVLAAEHGRQAVDLFVQRVADVQAVLLDQEMPVMNGEEAFRAIRAVRGDVPIVVMTGFGELSAQEHFGHLHPTAILGKPFTRTQLVEVLGRACQAAPGGAPG